jgi:hypothetical protein
MYFAWMNFEIICHACHARQICFSPSGEIHGGVLSHPRNNPMELIMFSQRKLSSPSDRGFVQMIWNAILLVQTRETTSLMTGRNR